MHLWGEVRLSQGRAEPPAGMDDLDDEPDAVVRYWAAEGVHGLHITDLDGALQRGKNWTAIETAVRSGLPVRFGGGVRHMTDVQQLLELGVRQVVVGTQGLDNPAWLAELALVFPDRVLVGLDVQEGLLLVDGRRRAASPWTAWAGEVASAKVAGLVYTQVVDGTPGAPELETVRRLSAQGPLTVAVGDAGATLEELADAGAAGCILTPEAMPEAWRDRS